MYYLISSPNKPLMPTLLFPCFHTRGIQDLQKLRIFPRTTAHKWQCRDSNPQLFTLDRLLLTIWQHFWSLPKLWLRPELVLTTSSSSRGMRWPQPSEEGGDWTPAGLVPLVHPGHVSLTPAQQLAPSPAAGRAARSPGRGRRKPPIRRGCGLEHPWDGKHLLLLPLFQLRAC